MRYTPPDFLVGFIDSQIPIWSKNALVALRVYHEGIHYVIQPCATTSKVLVAKPVDYTSTGIIQHRMTWSDGLQQFLQLKHGLRLTQETMTTNYISNMSFLLRFGPNLYGLTGTLGPTSDQNVLTEIYGVSRVSYNWLVVGGGAIGSSPPTNHYDGVFARSAPMIINPAYPSDLHLDASANGGVGGIVVKIIPEAYAKRVHYYQTLWVDGTRQDWLDGITQAVDVEVRRDRAVLVICSNIDDVFSVYENLEAHRNRMEADMDSMAPGGVGFADEDVFPAGNGAGNSYDVEDRAGVAAPRPGSRGGESSRSADRYSLLEGDDRRTKPSSTFSSSRKNVLKVQQAMRLSVFWDNSSPEQAQNLEMLWPRQVVVATNLAGRGTNANAHMIEQNGGLHVIVGFLPRNLRVQMQALGRTSRQGNSGSAQIILRRDETEIKRIFKVGGRVCTGREKRSEKSSSSSVRCASKTCVRGVNLQKPVLEKVPDANSLVAQVMTERDRAERLRVQEFQRVDQWVIATKDQFFHHVCDLFARLKLVLVGTHFLTAARMTSCEWMENSTHSHEVELGARLGGVLTHRVGLNEDLFEYK